MRERALNSISGLFFLGLFLLAPLDLVAGQTIEFNRDIRPILSDNCFACHGPDKASRKANLRLDLEEAAKAVRDGTHAVVPGDVAKSVLIDRVTASDADDVMPPPESGKSLSEAEIKLLTAWIEQGAPWQGHWAFIAPNRPGLPSTSNSSWSKQPIDQFILAKLDESGLSPSKSADRRTLIYRLSFDLTGLPPTPSEVSAFINDDRPQAYEELVDRLLSSTAYGERMAMHWLDLVRYADTVGFHGDQDISLWPFRDYVIRAFNGNMRFDRFTREQIAGDLLPDATLDQKTASGYNRLHMITAEGGAQDKEYRAKYAADRVRTTSTIWMGATLGCAECHDHKFDPYTTKDFYSFAAFFADLKEKGYYNGARWEPKMKVPTEEDIRKKETHNYNINRLNTLLNTPTEQLVRGQRGWEKHLLALDEAELLGWIPVLPEKVESSGGATLAVQGDLSVLSTGENPEKDNYTVTIKTDREKLTGIQLEALTHDSLEKKSLSRGNGNFVLTGFEVEVLQGKESVPVKIAKTHASFQQKDYPVGDALNDDKKKGWAVEGNNKHENQKAAFVFEKEIQGGPDTTLVIRLKHESESKHHNIGRFRLSLTSVERPTLDRYAMNEELVHIIRIPEDDRSEEQAAKLAKHYREVSGHLNPIRDELASTKKKLEQTENSIPTTLVSLKVEPRMMRVLPRGNWLDESGEEVKPNWPTFLSKPKKTERQNRIDLANWLMSDENPLAARAFVNRLWAMYFGTGISKALDDLGAQGEWPTHPDLLDWLAVEFRESGWDVKKLVKQIVTSEAYKQSSRVNGMLREKDPFNRLLARQSRFRLDAEMIRDNALSVSGLLQTKVGGPSVKPYQPAGYYSQLNFPKRTYKSDEGENQYRRGLYTHWQRTFLHPSMVAFDAPSREECTAERPRSNTPLQALVLLNDPSYVEAARVLAQNTMTNGGDSVEAKLRWTWQRVLARDPIDQEMSLLKQLFDKHLSDFKADEEGAGKLVKVGNAPDPEVEDVPALAAWTSIARVVLNLHETITRY